MAQKHSNKFKKLRKLASMLTGGFKPTAYKPLKPVFGKTELGQENKNVLLWLGQKVMNPECTRAVYQRLKLS